MKLKSLFLATLAAMAMVSCSNDNDPITDNGNQEVEKTALLDLGFAFPKATATKANGDKEAGTDDEYEFTNVAIIIDYPVTETNTTAKRVVEILSRDQFSPAEPSANTQQVVVYTKQAIKVEAKTAIINAIVNPSLTNPDLTEEKLKDATYLTLTETTLATEKLLDYSKNYSIDGEIASVETPETPTPTTSILKGKGGPAEPKHFMMTTETGITKTFIEGQTTTVAIEVNRVVAKLAEVSGDRVFTKQKDGKTPIETGLTTTDRIKSIEVVKATYVNLAETSNVFPATVNPTNLWQDYNPTETVSPATPDAGYSYFGLNGKNIEYCFENGNSHPTGIIYQAKVIWNENTEATTFYIAGGKLYMTYQALKDDFRKDCPTENATPTEFAAAHIRQYKDGQCYYYKPIKTNGATETIARNNVYKMSVTGIMKIGSSTPNTDGKETLMKLSIEVQPWTVNENAFVLQ